MAAPATDTNLKQLEGHKLGLCDELGDFSPGPGDQRADRVILGLLCGSCF